MGATQMAKFDWEIAQIETEEIAMEMNFAGGKLV
jgi:hypothetical protein